MVSELESCRAWEDNKEGTNTEAEELAAKSKALLMDRDSAQLDLQQFVIGQILRSCALPGFRAYNNLEMLDVATEPYHLVPTRESHTSGISTESTTKKPTAYSKIPKPTFYTARSTNPPSNAQNQITSRSTAQPMKINPLTVSKLNLPSDKMDCAYWLDSSRS